MPRASFDPRPRVGGDDEVVTLASGHEGFDPRPRVGGDALAAPIGRVEIVSIHAPAWGATAEEAQPDVIAMEFRSTPPRGGRQAKRLQKRAFNVFRSTPPRGGRRELGVEGF